jgi:hypothetical protein
VKIIPTALTPFLFLIPLCCQASNYGFLNESAVSNFTQEDTALFMAAQNTALNKTPNGLKVSWKNPKSGAYGFMIPSAAPTQNGKPCRKLLIFNNANGLSGQSTFKFCKINKTWKAFSP